MPQASKQKGKDGKSSSSSGGMGGNDPFSQGKMKVNAITPEVAKMKFDDVAG